MHISVREIIPNSWETERQKDRERFLLCSDLVLVIYIYMVWEFAKIKPWIDHWKGMSSPQLPCQVNKTWVFELCVFDLISYPAKITFCPVTYRNWKVQAFRTLHSKWKEISKTLKICISKTKICKNHGMLPSCLQCFDFLVHLNMKAKTYLLQNKEWNKGKSHDP